MTCKGVTPPTAEDRSNTPFLVFREGKIEIIKGTQTLTEIDLTNYYVQADSYLCENFDLLRETEVEVKPGNMSAVNGEVQFIAIQVIYPEDTLAVNKYIHWRYPEIGSAISPPQQMNIGELMVLTGSQTELMGWDLDGENSPNFGGLVLVNPHEAIDVKVAVLIVQ